MLTRHTFREGLIDGIPIFLGYLSVSFGFGVMVVNGGLSWLTAIFISATNVTSAGQVAGLRIILDNGTLWELIAAEIIINLRYALMSISLTQKVDGEFGIKQRLISGFCMTDEVYAVAASKTGSISANYMYGLISLPILGWTLGTLLGAVAGSLLPKVVLSSMGIMLYAMFIAIVLPPAKAHKDVAVCCLIAAVCSIGLKFIPAVSFGFRVIISAVSASVLAAYFFKESGEAA